MKTDIKYDRGVFAAFLVSDSTDYADSMILYFESPLDMEKNNERRFSEVLSTCFNHLHCINCSFNLSDQYANFFLGYSARGHGPRATRNKVSIFTQASLLGLCGCASSVILV